jgi:hypothetical protein
MVPRQLLRNKIQLLEPRIALGVRIRYSSVSVGIIINVSRPHYPRQGLQVDLEIKSKCSAADRILYSYQQPPS